MPQPSTAPVAKPRQPLKYKSVKELQSAIDDYFDRCDNRIKEVHSKEGEAYAISHPEPYTMSGLAVSLGLDRRSLINYSHREEYFPAIKAARAKVELDIERRMADKDTFTPGLIFNAKNNFGWTDKQEIEQHVTQAIVIMKPEKLPDAV